MFFYQKIFANIALDDGRHHNDGFRFVHPEMENTKAWDMMVNSTLGGKYLSFDNVSMQ
jgi:hypothetical protein